MKSVAVCAALALLLVGPALARPNLVEPIYLRRRSNPLEIVEESVEASTGTGREAAVTVVPASTEPSASSEGPGSSSTQQPRYQTTNDGLSSDSLIKEFLLKNLANLQGQSVGPQAPAGAGADEEQNTLRSVSPWASGLGYPPASGNWDPPEQTYLYPVQTGSPYGGGEPEGGSKRRPVIQKIMTKWSDKTADVFNVEYSTVPVGVGGGLLRPVSHVYSNFGVTPSAGSPEVYQPGPGPLVPLSSSGTKGGHKQKQKKHKHKIKISLKPTATVAPVAPLADPDRPDAVYSGELDPYGQQNFGGPGWDPYDDVAAASPYDEAGNLKGEAVTDAASAGCTDIRISVNGKQACNEIQIAINPEANPSPTKQGDLTKTGPGVGAGSAALASAILPAAGAAGALAAAPQSAAAPVAVASDVALASPLAAAAVPPVVPGLFAPPVVPGGGGTSLLNTPLSSIVSNIIRPPVRLGAAANPATTLGNGLSSNGGGHKHKPKPGKPSHGHDSAGLGLGALMPDASHALVGMLAALSAMTPMNLFVLGLSSLPVLAMVVGTLAAGVYMYRSSSSSSYHPAPVRHYTTTVLVQKKPPMAYHWTRRPARPRPPTRYSWVDHDHGSAVPLGWDYDRRSMRLDRTRPSVPFIPDPYRFHFRPNVTATARFSFKRPEPLLKTKIGTSGFVVSTSTKVLTGGASAASGHSASGSTKARPQSGEAKANEQLTSLFERHSGHAGVAEPMTDEEYQSELQRATERPLPRTTTPREGLSTWVLLSGSDSSELAADATSTTRKAPIVKSTTVATTSTPKPTTATKRFQPTTRRIVPTTTSRPARTTTTPSSGSEEKKEKFNKAPAKQKVATTTLKPVIVKKVKKPSAGTTTATTTTTTTSTTKKPTTPASTSTTTSTTTEMVLTEQSPSTVANDGPAPAVTEDSSAESSTFLIMEPKDALFDLPEDRSPAKTAPAAVAAATKGKKPTRKPNQGKNPGAGGKKKPANKKTRKPEVKDGVAGEKKPAANKNKPVSTQIINYLSREVMPTVGVGLVGLVMAAGLASYFLGSPLGALRRSDDRKDDLYYSNYEEYAGADGQNEEDVFGKLIAGMPDRGYYRNSNAVRRRTQQPVRTGHQYYHVQPYSANKYPHISYRNRAYAGAGPSAPDALYTNVNRQAQVQVQQSQAKAQNEFYYNTPPTPYYPTRSVAIETATRQPAAPVYSSTFVPSTTTGAASPTPGSAVSTPASPVAADPIVEPEHEMMPHPEAYSAEHSPEHHAHYVVGSSYGADGMDMYGSVPEHGPRRKRAVTEVDGNDDDDFDNEIDVDEDRPKDETGVVVDVAAAGGAATPEATTSVEGTDITTDSAEGTETTTTTTTMTATGGNVHRYTWGDFIRNTVERKVAMGIHFLQHVTMDFQRYLNGVQNHFPHPPQHNPTDEHDTRRH